MIFSSFIKNEKTNKSIKYSGGTDDKGGLKKVLLSGRKCPAFVARPRMTRSHISHYTLRRDDDDRGIPLEIFRHTHFYVAGA